MPTPPPPEEHRFKPGADWRGNAKGRPKKCPLTARFEDFIEGSELVTIGKDGKAQRTRLPDGLTVADMIVLAWAKKAILGDAMARKDALERLEGKVLDRHELSGPGGAPVGVRIVEVVRPFAKPEKVEE